MYTYKTNLALILLPHTGTGSYGKSVNKNVVPMVSIVSIVYLGQGSIERCVPRMQSAIKNKYHVDDAWSAYHSVNVVIPGVIDDHKN